MPISAISSYEAYCSYKTRNRFLAGNEGKLSAMDVKELSAIIFLKQVPHGYG
jgi:hypothetical protein